jgi:hypothetical protein
MVFVWHSMTLAKQIATLPSDIRSRDNSPGALGNGVEARPNDLLIALP